MSRITLDAGLQTDVTWSPDSESIAYASDKAGNFDIWVQSLNGGAVVPLTRSPEHERYPTWSPDGASIVYRSEHDGGGLFVTPASGGAERRLTRFGTRPKWSPDGSTVLFSSSAGIVGQVVPVLYIVRTNGEQPARALESVLAGIGEVRDWDWAPDGRVSILGRAATDELSVYTTELSGAHVVRTSLPPEVGDPVHFRWARNGHAIYLEQREASVSNVWRATVDPTSLAIGAIERLTAGDGWNSALAPSPSGRRVAFTMSRRPIRLWSFAFDPGQGRIGESHAVTPIDVVPAGWDLSRDGQRVAYASLVAGSVDAQLWLTDIDSGIATKVVADDQDRWDPQWAPDGTRLASSWYHRLPDASFEQAIVVRRVGENGEQVITTPIRTTGRNRIWAYDWTPDGTAILGGVRVDPALNVALALWPLAAAPTAERAMKIIASDPSSSLWEAQFSPDGRWIACLSVAMRKDAVQVDQPSIAILPSRGAASDAWTRIRSDDWVDKPRWSPDGARLYFVRRQGSFFNLWSVTFDGRRGVAGPPEQVTRFDSPRFQISPTLLGAEVGVTANRLVLTMMEESGSIWTIDNVDR